MKLRTSQKGAAVVEFALLSLLLLVFVFGIIEFGFLWVQSHYVANAAREGARVAAKIKGDNPAAVFARQSAAENAAREYLRAFFMYGDKVDNPGSNPGFLTIAVSEGNLPMASPPTPVPRLVQVTVTAQSEQIWQPILWPLLNLLPGGNIFPDDFLTSITQSADYVILR
jgi:Flp pilus assembly protein TadG